MVENSCEMPVHMIFPPNTGFSGNSVNFTTGNPDIFVFRVARGNFMGNASYLYRQLAFHMKFPPNKKI